MDHASVHPAEGLLINLAPGHDRAARDVAATKRFREGDDIRLQVPMLKAEHRAGPPEPGLDFVANEKGAEFAAEFLGAIEEVARGSFATFALDRLDHESSHVALGKFA